MQRGGGGVWIDAFFLSAGCLGVVCVRVKVGRKDGHTSMEEGS